MNNLPERKEQAQRAWQKLERWIRAKGLKVVLIVEGDKNRTTKKFIKNLEKWTADSSVVQRVKIKQRQLEEASSYFDPLMACLPKAGQVTVFENCWYENSIKKNQVGKWGTTLWNEFAAQEDILQQSNYIFVKYALRSSKDPDNPIHPVFEILRRTEHPDNSFFYFNCKETDGEVISLIQHFVQQVPHEAVTFPNSKINFEILKQRAYNFRWASVEEGVIPLTAADPDFPIAPEIQKAIIDYTREGHFCYGPAEGLPAFKKAASKVLEERKGIICPPECILPTDGAASAMYTIAKFALQPGDEAIIFDPVDFLFQRSVEAAGGKVVRVPMNAETGSFDPKEFLAAISPKTKMIGLCNPHNPMGRVLTRQELMFIGSIAVKHNIWIMNDEIWSDIVYPNEEHINIAALHPDIFQQTISVYGFSKTFGLAGLRVGFIAAPSSPVFEEILQTSKANTTAGGVSTLSQVAATAAYESCWYWADAFIEHLTEVRDYAVERLNKMQGITCRKPEGTYLLFPNIEALGLKSEEVAAYLLEHAKVAVVPGVSRFFGPGAEGHIRICFSTSMEIIKEALDRIEVALEQLAEEQKAKKEAIQFEDLDVENVVFL